MSLQLLADAVAAGARLEQACELLGLTVRTVQRWRADLGGDDMRRGPASAPHNKLNPAEERRLIKLVNLPRYRELSPRQIIPMLATWQGPWAVRARGRRVGGRVATSACAIPKAPSVPRKAR